MLIDKVPAVTFTIYGQPATKKNSPQLVRGRSIVLPSKAYRAYAKEFHSQLIAMRLPHYDGAVALSVAYYLQDRRHYPDLNGLIQATQDLLSDEYTRLNGKRVLAKRWVLADDRIVKCLDGCCIAGIDKEEPKAVITITPVDVDPVHETDPYLLRLLKEKAYGKDKGICGE